MYLNEGLGLSLLLLRRKLVGRKLRRMNRVDINSRGYGLEEEIQPWAVKQTTAL
jgi:hypothetical protein